MEQLIQYILQVMNFFIPIVITVLYCYLMNDLRKISLSIDRLKEEVKEEAEYSENFRITTDKELGELRLFQRYGNRTYLIEGKECTLDKVVKGDFSTYSNWVIVKTKDGFEKSVSTSLLDELIKKMKQMTEEQIEILEAIREIEKQVEILKTIREIEEKKENILNNFFGTDNFNIKEVPAFKDLLSALKDKS